MRYSERVEGGDTLLDPALPLATDELQALAAVLARPAHATAGPVDGDDEEVFDTGEGSEAPVERLRLLPRQRDEFNCRGCYLVVHMSRQARPGLCVDCA